MIRSSVQDEKSVLLLDRYFFSGIAYSAAKGLNFEWCRNCDVGLPIPDFVVYLDIDPLISASRKGYGEEKYEKIEFQKQVQASYQKLYLEYKDQCNWISIKVSNDQSPTQISLTIKESLSLK